MRRQINSAMLRRRKMMIAWVVAADALLILLPFMHWVFLRGNAWPALIYVIGAPAVIAVSLFLLDRIVGSLTIEEE